MGNRPYVWKGGEETDKYDAIIDCPHYVSQRRPHMSMIDRAAQFSPFDALEEYSDEIVETGRTTEDRIELSEAQMDELNEKIGLLNLKLSDVEFVFKTEAKSNETQRMFNDIKGLQKHHSIVKIGTSKPRYIKDRAFWELYKSLHLD